MNLYRSFGNLMETWMTERRPDQDWLERREDDPPSPPSDVDTNVRPESVDSGVETASSDSSFPTISVPSDLDTFLPERHGIVMSQSPVLSLPAPSSSSSSPYPVSSRSKIEQALSRIESVQEKRPVPTVDELIKRRPMSSLLPKRHASDLLRGQRSGSFVLRKAPSVSLLVRPISEGQRRPQSAIYDRQTSDVVPEGSFGDMTSELSPGLVYLEQVCQMLEDYAREQLHLNTQAEAIEETLEEQATGTCQDVAAGKETPTNQLLKRTHTETSPSATPPRRERPYGHLRQRSVSDTNLATLHLRRMKEDFHEHNFSTHDLLEAEEEGQETQSRNEESNKSRSYWKLKLGSFRRDATAKSQQMQSFEKSTTRRRLSQLFRRRRKTGPV